MSYASVVRKNECLAEETIWLQIGEGVVQGREEKLRRCLVGKFGEGSFSVSEAWALEMWAMCTWQLRSGLQVYVFGGSLILFEFEDCLEAEGCWLEDLGGLGRDFSVWKDGNTRLGVW